MGAFSVANQANTVSVGAVGLERKIVNVAAGTIASGSTDAATAGQLYTANQRVADAFGTTLTNGIMNAPSYTILGTSYNNVGSAFSAVNSGLSALQNGTSGLVQQNNAGQPITIGANTGGTLINIGGAAGSRTITGLAAGIVSAASGDAVNGSQLYAANQRVADAFGTTLANGLLNAPVYTIQGTNYNNVGSAFGAVNTSLNTLQTQISSGTIGLVQQSAAGQPITIGANTDGTVVNVAGTAGNRTVTGVAAGTLSSSSTDAVNGSQLYATNQQVAANTADIAGLTSTVAGLSTGNSTYIKNNDSGPAASATGTNANAIGSGANAAGSNSLAFGTNASAADAGNIAIGQNSNASGANAIAIGIGAVSAANSVVIGPGATDNNFTNASVYGVNAQVGATGNVAIGDSANAASANSVAVGQNAIVLASNGSAFGQGATVQAGATNSVAIGQGSVASAPNTVSVGAAGNERRITNVAAGVNGTDAVNVNQLNSVVASMNYQPQIDSLQSQVNDTNRRVDKANSGVAMAMAMGGGGLPDNKKYALGINYGTFAGQNALALQSALRLSENIVASGAVGFGIDQKQVGGRVGVQFAW